MKERKKIWEHILILPTLPGGKKMTREDQEKNLESCTYIAYYSRGKKSYEHQM